MSVDGQAALPIISVMSPPSEAFYFGAHPIYDSDLCPGDFSLVSFCTLPQRHRRFLIISYFESYKRLYPHLSFPVKDIPSTVAIP
jgi:hypothetical protein